MKVTEVFKTIFARFGNIKAGKFVDDETGESLNDVAKVLSEFNIELYDSEGNMRNVNTILTELSQGWENYTQVQKNAIASAVAGVRQYENFIVLMNNFGKAQDYAGIATESAGIAMEKFGGYTEGIEATMNELKTTVEEVALKFIDSETIITIMETLSSVVGFLADNVWILEGAVRALLLLGVVKGMQLVGNSFKTLILRANNFTTATVGMQGAINGVTTKTFSAATATNIFNQSMAMLGMTTSGVTAKEAIRQLKMTGLWGTIKKLDFATQQQILTMMGYDAQVIKEILKTGTWSTANITLSGTFKGLGAAIKGMMASNPIGWIMLAVSGVIELCMWLGTLNDETDELAENQETAAEKLDRLSDELETAKTAAEDATKALEENLAAIKELEAKESLTYVEDEELQKLKDATQELRWQAEIKNQTSTDTQRQYLEEQRKYYDDMIAPTKYMQTENTIQDDVDYLRILEKQGEKTLESLAKDFEDYANGVEGASRIATASVLTLYYNAKKDLGELYKLGANASEEDIKKAQDELGKYSSELRTSLGEVQSFIESVTSVPENQRLEIFGSDWEEKLDVAIRIRDTLLRVLDPSAYEKIKFSEFLDLDELKEIKALVSDLGFEGDLTADILKEKLGEQGYGDLEGKIKAAGLSIETFISWLNSQTNATEKAAQNISAIKEEIEKLKDVYSTLSDGIKEYNNQGYFTFETMQEILDLGVEYIGYLIDENGNIRKNTNTLEDYLRLKLQEQAYVQAVNYVKSFANKTDAEATKIIQGQTLATEGVTEANLKFLASEIALLPLSREVKTQIWQQTAAMIEYAGSVSFTSESIEELTEATEDYEKVLKAIDIIIESHIKKKEKLIEKEQEAIDAIDEEIDKIEKSKRTYEDKIDAIDEEIDKIEKSKRTYEDKIDVIDEEIDKIQESIDATQEKIDLINEEIEAIEERNEKLNEEIEFYDDIISASKNYINKKISALEEEKKLLQDKNEEKEKEIELEELQRNLQKAQQKTMRVFSAEKGTWEWVVDEAAVKKAERDIEKYNNQEEIDSIDKEIESWQEYLELIEEIPNAFENARLDDILNSNGIISKEDIDDKNLKVFENLKSKYKQNEEKQANNNEEIKNHQKTIESLEKKIKVLEKEIKTLEKSKKPYQEKIEFYDKEIDRLNRSKEPYQEKIKFYDKEIDRLNRSKEPYQNRIKALEDTIELLNKEKNKWKEIKEAYDVQEAKLLLAQKQGRTDENNILRGKLADFGAFKREYFKALKAVRNKTTEETKKIKTSFDNIDFLKMAKEQIIAEQLKNLVLIGAVKLTDFVKYQKGKISYKDIKILTEKEMKKKVLEGTLTAEDLVSYKKSMNILKGYASGTKSAKLGLATVDEKGNELIVPKQGRYRMMEYGDTVVPHNLSQRIFEVASNPLRFVANALNSVKTPNLMSNSNQVSNSSIISIGTIELPSVTNGDNFIKQLQLIASNR